ncbi:PREDICTED: uncharacterized protein LOC104599459 isoform X2 [Nelumbo nucifera]|uniref:Uncharacterized protein LOC104599459 isoform X2 n=1 Tax=Nelumbo nucifera TaxID=4432 RepID=A0A1U8AES2_NELNU|nr:PREDICTED: uncharacterized protein LOC104599459 isoform X2 [Nelumbo nucifera]
MTTSGIILYDDINQSDKEQEFGHSTEGLSSESASMHNEIPVVREQFHASQHSTEWTTVRASVLDEEYKGHLPNIIVLTSSWMEKLNALYTAVYRNLLVLYIKMQVYLGFHLLLALVVRIDLLKAEVHSDSYKTASDDSAENDDDGPCLEDVSTVKVSPSSTIGPKSSDNDVETNLDTTIGSGSASMTEKGFISVSGSVVACPVRMPDDSPETHIVLEITLKASSPVDVVRETNELRVNNHGNQISSDQAASHQAFEHNDDLQGDLADIDPQDGNLQKEDTQSSTQLKVDKFVRLKREGGSDSESDGLRYAGRHGKRSRSWSQSQSRSPPGRKRSRSPQRREKQRRSHSWSPKKQINRTGSPAFRCIGVRFQIA